MDITIDMNPVFLGGMMQELGTTPPAMQNDLKAKYLAKDLDRWSEKHKIPYEFPDVFPINSLPALRGILAQDYEAPEQKMDYVSNVFNAAWVNNEDIADKDVLLNCLPDGSLDEEVFLDRIDDEEIKDELKNRTDEAMDRGVFGCPTFFVDGEMFWGKDRFAFVLDALN